MSPAAATPIRWCTFRIGDACFAVAADRVVEVLQRRRLTAVPLADPGLLGLVQLRGRIVPVILPGTGLGLPAPSSGAERLLVFTAGDDWYALLVDEVLDILAIPPEQIERPTPSEGCLVGMVPASGGLVHLVDPEAMLAGLARGPAAARRTQEHATS